MKFQRVSEIVWVVVLYLAITYHLLFVDLSAAYWGAMACIGIAILIAGRQQP